MLCIDIIRFIKRNFYRIFPLKKEETDQLKRANSKDDKDTGIVLQRQGDHWMVEALIIKEDFPTLVTVQLLFNYLFAVALSSSSQPSLCNWQSNTLEMTRIK